MYLHCKTGFYEVDRYQNTPIDACAMAEGGAKEYRPETDDIIVRARTREDLERLLELYADDPMTVSPILHTPQWDYQWRVYMSEASWALMMSTIAYDLDYRNFKAWTSNHAPDQHRLAYAIWEAGAHER